MAHAWTYADSMCLKGELTHGHPLEILSGCVWKIWWDGLFFKSHIYIYIYGHVPKPIVYEVHLERACAGGGCATFLFLFVFSMVFLCYFPGGAPEAPQRHPKRVRQGCANKFSELPFWALLLPQVWTNEKHYNNQHIYKEKHMKTKENQIRNIDPQRTKICTHTLI